MPQLETETGWGDGEYPFVNQFTPALTADTGKHERLDPSNTERLDPVIDVLGASHPVDAREV
ncbi:hypothetical protein [Geobacter sp. FeAm09]|uniref:hypothetical protein n=1 Tax=Geobacter sp. FeAm09 TaxID=2597769 RepID=UPI001F0F10F0|nr:hypothetical protein [Geobacter sp. FeAm09]